MSAAERRRSAPIAAAERDALMAGSADHAQHWALAAREAGLERLAREVVQAIATTRRSPGRDDARAACWQSDLCFYRMHALRCRDAARRLTSERWAPRPQSATGSSKTSYGASIDRKHRPQETDLV
jgi:hypothetical protein